MRGVLLVMRGTLVVIVQGANVVSVMIGLMIGQMVLPERETVGDPMVEIVGVNLGIGDLVVIPLRGGLLMRSSVFMRTAGILMAPGVQGGVAVVEALQHGHPLPVVVLQPREVRRQLGILALARHPQTGAQSTSHARAQLVVGQRWIRERSWNIWARLWRGNEPSARGQSSGKTERIVL